MLANSHLATGIAAIVWLVSTNTAGNTTFGLGDVSLAQSPLTLKKRNRLQPLENKAP